MLKRQELAYGIRAVFQEHLPSLQHGNDGLIFTSAEACYTPGTDRKMCAFFSASADEINSKTSLKWKPPSENSVDFLLQLKFPALANDHYEPDFSAKPKFMLMMNCGREGNLYYDTMEVDDDEWER